MTNDLCKAGIAMEEMSKKASEREHSADDGKPIMEHVVEANLPTKYGDFKIHGYVNRLNGCLLYTSSAAGFFQDTETLVHKRNVCLFCFFQLFDQLFDLFLTFSAAFSSLGKLFYVFEFFCALADCIGDIAFCHLVARADYFVSFHFSNSLFSSLYEITRIYIFFLYYITLYRSKSIFTRNSEKLKKYMHRRKTM